MTDGNETQKTPRDNSRKIILSAALAGILAGAVAVYVMERPSGNIVAGTNPSADQCALKTADAKKIDGAAVGAVAAMRGADSPQSMSALTFTAPDGKPARLGDFKGKTLLVNLWATWCVPCREEMPALDALETKKGGDNFQVVTINIDTGDDEKPKAFLERDRRQVAAALSRSIDGRIQRSEAQEPRFRSAGDDACRQGRLPDCGDERSGRLVQR